MVYSQIFILMFFKNESEGLFDLLEAVLANTLTAEEYDIVCISAEYTRGLIFLKDYSVFVGKYFKRVFFIYVHSLSYTDGKNYSSKLIHFTNDSG